MTMDRDTRWFRRLLRLLPADFQADYARDMERTFRAQHRDALEKGRGRMIRLWMDTLLDLVRTAPREHLDQLSQDVTFALRNMGRRRGATLAAVATLAIGIGGVTAIASVVNGVDWRPLGYPAPERVVFVQETQRGEAIGTTGWLTFNDWRDRSRAFEVVAAIASRMGTIAGGGGDPEQITGMGVTPDFFRVIGVAPVLGRAFTEAENRWSNRRFIILGHRLWQRRFNADPSIVGRAVSLGGFPYVVVGVMPPLPDLIAEELYDHANFWTPLGYDASLPFACRTCRHIRVLARLKPGVSAAQAEAELASITAQLGREHPTQYAAAGARVITASDVVLGPVRPALYLPLAAVCVLLLIAGVNVSNLHLVRSIERSGEIATRRALGMATGRLVRQLLTESFVLAALGGLAGLAVAWGAMRLLVASAPASIPRIADVSMDGRVLALALVATGGVALLFGLLPAWHLASADVVGSLRGSSRSLVVGGGRVGRLLVAGNVALAVLLLVVTGLLTRSFVRLLDVDPGFDPRNVVTANIVLSGPAYNEDAPALVFWQRVLDGVRAPGLDVALTTQLPFQRNDSAGFHVDGRVGANPEESPSADRFGITADYFRTMRIPVIRGRSFTERDNATAPFVAIVNQAVVDQVFGGRDPIGQRIMLGGHDGPKRTIVGIVGDVRHRGLEEPVSLQAYVPHSQHYQGPMFLVVRGGGDVAQVTSRVRATMRAIDPGQALHDVRTYESLIAETVAERRFLLLLVAGFSGAALLLAAVGLYGVVSYIVSQRTHEIGLRVALGAASPDIRRLVLGIGMLPVAAGVVGGLALASLAIRPVRSMLFEVGAGDPGAISASLAVLIGVALMACYIPARRASRLDPVTALRAE